MADGYFCTIESTKSLKFVVSESRTFSTIKERQILPNLFWGYQEVWFLVNNWIWDSSCESKWYKASTYYCMKGTFLQNKHMEVRVLTLLGTMYGKGLPLDLPFPGCGTSSKALHSGSVCSTCPMPSASTSLCHHLLANTTPSQSSLPVSDNASTGMPLLTLSRERLKHSSSVNMEISIWSEPNPGSRLSRGANGERGTCLIQTG